MSVLTTPVPDQVNLTWTLSSVWLQVVELRGAIGEQLLPHEVADVQARIADATQVLLDLKDGDGVSFPDPAAPYALISIPPSRQGAFALGLYRYEVRLIDLQGLAFSLQYGAITVAPSLFTEFTPPAGSGSAGGGFDFDDPANSDFISLA